MQNRRLGLEDLPWLVLHQICAYLESGSDSALSKFAQASKHCWSTARPLLFHTIKIDVTAPEELFSTVERCDQILRRSSIVEHVRRVIFNNTTSLLNVSDRCPPSRSTDPTNQYGSASLYGHWDRILDIIGSSGHSIPYRATDAILRLYSIPYTVTDAVLQLNNKAWSLLAKLIVDMLHLSDFIYSSVDQVPPVVLDAIQQHTFGCRLHVGPFRLRSLTEMILQSNELALATSTALHTVCFQYEDEDFLDYKDWQSLFQLRVVKLLVAGLAPGLRQVHMCQTTIQNDDDLFLNRALWKAFDLDGPPSPKLGSLECLQIRGYDPLTRNEVQEWQSLTNFSLLRVLKLMLPIEEGAMESLARSDDLRSLVTLSLALPPQGSDQYYDLVAIFLTKLQDLTSLEMRNWSPQLTMRPFSSNLRTLWLRHEHRAGILTNSAVSHLVQTCPLLENLCMTVRRSKGDADEVRIYQSLGRLPRLQTLELSLYVLATSPPPKDKISRQDILINCAMDEHLARSIFDTIQASKCGDRSVPLQHLQVCTVGWDDLNLIYTTLHPSFGFFYKCMSRTYALDRYVDSENAPQLQVKRLKPDEETASNMERAYNNPRHGPSLGTAIRFRQLWPSKSGIEDPDDAAFLEGWWDDWHSWPLAQLEEEETKHD